MLLEIYIIFFCLKQDILFKKNSFLPSTIILLNRGVNLIRTRISSNFNIFRKNTLKFIRPSANSLLNCHNPKGIKFITRLWLGFSLLREHKFKYSFHYSLNPFCSCCLDNESTVNFLLHCPIYTTKRRIFLDLCEPVSIRTLLFGSTRIICKFFYFTFLVKFSL